MNFLEGLVLGSILGYVLFRKPASTAPAGVVKV
jgi:hypothetical protein